MNNDHAAVCAAVAHDNPASVDGLSLDNSVLRHAMASTRDGVSISNARLPDMPLIYVNPAFSRMTGYQLDEIVGKNCRFLQGEESNQPSLKILRDALAAGESCLITLRNFRKDGVLFHNELSMSPVFDDDGELTHYIGIQKDVTRRVRAEQRLAQRERQLQTLNKKLEKLAQRDSLTGLYNRRAIDEHLDREWRRALRSDEWLSVYMIDVDKFKQINDQYGHAVGDDCLQRVTRVLEHCFGRGYDYVGRFGGDEFVVVSTSLDPEQAAAQGRNLIATMRLAGLPEPLEKLTISAGVATLKPCHSSSIAALLKAADSALYKAKTSGRDRLGVHKTHSE